MYGAFYGISFGLVAGVALLVIALAVFASPLFAVLIAVVAAVFLLIGMSALRQRSAAADQSEGGGADRGAPVSGEGS
jgi:membrane protein implicated in regulation of membrane protease activity